MIMSAAVGPMWTNREFRVGDRQVTASIRVLAPGQRQAIAASMAWLAGASAAPDDPNARAWKTLIEDVLGPHLALTVDHQEPEQLDRAWWTETIRQATAEFIDVNELESLIARSWSSWLSSSTMAQ